MIIKTKTVSQKLADIALRKILYSLALLKFSVFFIFQWKKINSAYKNPKKTQAETFRYILNKNKEVSYLRQYSLKDNPSYSEFAEKLPIRNYEVFRPYIEKKYKHR